MPLFNNFTSDQLLTLQNIVKQAEKVPAGSPFPAVLARDITRLLVSLNFDPDLPGPVNKPRFWEKLRDNPFGWLLNLFYRTVSTEYPNVQLLVEGTPNTDEYYARSLNAISRVTGSLLLTQALTFHQPFASLILLEAAACPELLTLDFPALTGVGNPAVSSANVNIGGAKLTRVSFPVLEKYHGIGAFGIQGNANLVTLELPVFKGSYDATSSSTLIFSTNAKLAALNLPSLARLGPAGLLAKTCALLTTINVPLDTLTFAAVATVVIDFSADALPIAEVNRVLRLLANNAALTGAGPIVNLNGGTNGAPSGDGVTAKNQLIARGVTVNTN